MMPHPPSLIVFGPLEPWPAGNRIKELRSQLQRNPLFHPFLDTVKALPSLWTCLADQNPGLKTVPIRHAIETITDLVGGAAPVNCRSWTSQNTITLPITIIAQIVEYCSYLEHFGTHMNQQTVLESVKQKGGIQGFCAGLLSALAVASSRSKEDVVQFATTSVKLAFCIGAFIDSDQISDADDSGYSMLAIRWKESTMLEEIQQALLCQTNTYIAVTRDKRDITATVPTSTMLVVQQQLAQYGAISVDTGMTGRYHCSAHQGVASRIWESCRELLRPWPESYGVVGSNIDGQPIPEHEMTLVALRSILEHHANWYQTMSVAVSALQSTPDSHSVLCVGADAIPPSLLGGLSVSKARALTQGDHRAPDDIPSLLTSPVYPDHAIAVVGMAGKFPGANTMEEFWDLLVKRESMLGQMPTERFDTSRLPRSSNNTRFWGNFVSDIASFDHRFFQKSSREAAAMDPQQRLLMEVTYQALESSGYFADTSIPRDIGCYIGACATDYDGNIGSHPPSAFATTGTLRAFLSGKLSHYFGWSGPSMTFDTACSSSAVAIHTACTALQAGECSQAVAGGATLFTTPYLYENLSAAHFLSPTGATKPFDAKADGYCRGEGVGMVVLKRLREALADRDNILGVIAGSAVNQNANCVSITVPHSPSQSTLYRKVVNQAGILPHAVSFVEAHGTGTPVGDPIELESIRQVFGGAGRKSDLYVSSVKGNIGHLEGASGVAALIKALLQMKHRAVCPQASFETLNPRIRPLEVDKMCIPRSIRPISAATMAACINNYGAAGSNAAIILLEAPSQIKQGQGRLATNEGKRLEKYPIQIAAGSEASLLRYCQLLEEFCQRIWRTADDRQRDHLWADVAFSLARQQNKRLPFMLTASCNGLFELCEVLRGQSAQKNDLQPRPKPTSVVMCFGGQVSRQVRLSKRFYESCALLRAYLDLCHETLQEMGYPGIYPAIFQAEPITDIVVLHSAVVSTQFACARAWIDSGLKVDTLLGHSLGQLTALCVSGALSLADGLRLVAGRASLMKEHWGLEPGTMVAVEVDQDTICGIMQALTFSDPANKYEIACYNGPTSHVVVSDESSAVRLQEELTRQSIRYKRLQVTHGFHSRFTEPLISELRSLATSLTIREAKVPIEACSESLTGAPITPESIAAHTREPVYFHQAVTRVQDKLKSCTFLEAGSGSGITSMVRRALAKSENVSHKYIPVQLNEESALKSMLDTTVELWNEGHPVQFWHFHRKQAPEYNVLSLPPYQFERNRHWLDIRFPLPEQHQADKTGVAVSPQPPALVSLRSSDDQIFYFDVNPRSDEYKELVGGRVTLGEANCPLFVYLEIVCRAVKASIEVHENWLLSVKELQLHASLGLDETRHIELCIQRIDGELVFSISSQSNSFNTPDQTKICHATGLVPIPEPSGALVKEIGRFERLAGLERVARIHSESEAESIRGSMIYKVLSPLVRYSEIYRNVKSISASDSLIAGEVRLAKRILSTDYVSHPHILDNFLQVSEIHSNCMWNTSADSFYCLTGVDRVQFAPGFPGNRPIVPEHAGWQVLCFPMPRDGEQVVYDSFIFNTATRKLDLFILGARYTKTRRHLAIDIPSTIPRDCSTPPNPNTGSHSTWDDLEPSVCRKEIQHSVAPDSRAKVYSVVCNILENIADVPRAEIRGNASVEDLGVDSLMMIEVIDELSKKLSMNLPLEELEDLPNVDALVDLLLAKRGDSNNFDAPQGGQGVSPSSDGSSWGLSTSTSTVDSAMSEALDPSPDMAECNDFDWTVIRRLQHTFNDIRLDMEKYVCRTEFDGFWEHVYPRQAALVEAYIMEGFRDLGCDISQLSAGQPIPPLTRTLPKYQPLVKQLFKVLAQGGLIHSQDDGGYARTAMPADPTPAGALFERMLQKYPQYGAETKLLDISASRLSQCLTGKVEPLQLLFANRANRAVMADVYRDAPMCRATTYLLADFLVRTFADHPFQPGRRLRIIEVGAGTGGTAAHLADILIRHNIPFEYTFTDVSSSLVSQAKKTFSEYKMMNYMTLDCDQPPSAELCGKFDVVIATNCIHATQNAATSAANIRRLLRKEGFLCLVEFTKGIYWFDLVYGLLEGWWVFRDGRQHALADQWFWNDTLRAAGYRHVSWTDGNTLEAQTTRLICAFSAETTDELFIPAPRSVTKRLGFPMETFVWKEVGNLKLQADIYYPKTADGPHESRPIALMIHGGGHLLFGRQDIPMKHVRQLLKRGFLPVSVDYRLCPELSLYDGPVTDCRDALRWVRETLPMLPLGAPGVRIKPGKVLALGWSSGGQLAMTLAYAGIPPPDVILPFYSPSNLEADFWNQPIYPAAAEEPPTAIWGALDCVRQEPLVSYSPISRKNATGLSLTIEDDRARLVLHMNWKAQSVPILIRGLPPKSKVQPDDRTDWLQLPSPPIEKIRQCSPYWHILSGTYRTPTFMVHGNCDDWIPFQMSQETIAALDARGVPCGILVPDQCGHAFDLFPREDKLGVGWQAIEAAYDFACNQLCM